MRLKTPLLLLSVFTVAVCQVVDYNPGVQNAPGLLSDQQRTPFATFYAACAAAVTANKTLAVTKTWNVATSATCAAPLRFFSNGLVKPTSSHTATLTGTITAPVYQQIFDISAAGFVRVAQREQEITWYGANWKNNSAFDSAPAINAAFNSASSGVEVLHLHWAGGIYYAGPLTMVNGVSIDGDGKGVTYFAYNGTSGQDAFTYTGDNTNFHLRGFTIAGQSGHIPRNGLVFTQFLDNNSVVGDFSVENVSGDCIQINGWINFYFEGNTRVDKCGTTGLHLIPQVSSFVNNFYLGNFTMTTVGNQATQQLIYMDNANTAAQDVGNFHFSDARFEINALMASPFAIFRVNNLAMTLSIDNVTVDNTVGDTNAIFLYTSNRFAFHLQNIRPQSTWFNSTWGAALTGLQTSANYIEVLDYSGSSGSSNATALRYTLGPALSTCNIDAGAGVGASCSISTVWHSSNNAMVIHLTTGSSDITPNGVLARIPFSVPDLWDFKIPVCSVIGFANFPPVAGASHIYGYAISATPPLLFLGSDSVGPTISSTYDVEVICQ